MKKYKIIYQDYNFNKVTEIFVEAMCEEDAHDFFFKNKSGMLLRVEFVEYV